MIVTITTCQSTTLKSAQSKKCRLLKKVRLNEIHYKVAIAIMNADKMLSEIMTEDDINNSRLGLQVVRNRSTATVLEIEIDD